MHHCDASQVLCIFVFYKLLDTQQKLWGYLVRQLALWYATFFHSILCMCAYVYNYGFNTKCTHDWWQSKLHVSKCVNIINFQNKHALQYWLRSRVVQPMQYHKYIAKLKVKLWALGWGANYLQPLPWFLLWRIKSSIKYIVMFNHWACSTDTEVWDTW